MLSKLVALLATSTVALAGPLATTNRSSSNWCGQVLSGKNFKTVEASWVVSNVSYPADADKTQQYFSSAWVGIDGVDGCSGLLQAGTSVGLGGEGDVWHYTWVEFYPADTEDIDLDFEVGDTIYTKITATSKTTGTVYMENKSTGKFATKKLTAPKDVELCFEHVEWIEEDPGGGLPFPAFDTFSMTGAFATDSKGAKHTLQGAETFDLIQDHQQLCASSVKSDSSVEFKYTGKRE